MKKSKLKGVALITTLVLMIVMSIFLMSSVYKTQSGIFATKRAVQEIKSYWAARAGFAIASNGILKNIYWPFAGSAGDGEGYSITRNGDIVIGRDDETGSEFQIYSMSKFSGGTGESSKIHSSVSSIPYPNMRDRMTIDKLQNGEAYFLSVGSCGSSVCGLEMIYYVAQTADEVSSSAAAYAGGAIDATVSTKLVIQQKNGARPCLIAKSGGISVQGMGGVPNKYSAGSLDIGEGCVFTSGNLNLNGQSITPSYTSNNLLSYGVNVYPSTGVNPPDIKKPSADENAIPLPAGTYCFIEMPSSYTEEEFKQSAKDCFSMYSPRTFYYTYKNNNSISFGDVSIQYGEVLKAFESSEPVVEYDGVFNDMFNRLFEDKSPEDIKAYIKDGISKDMISYNEWDGGFVQCGLAIFDWFGGSDDDSWDELDDFDEAKKDIFLSQYKDYLARKINLYLSGYRATEKLGYKQFESFYIPPGTSIVSKNNEEINISFVNLTRSRVFGNLIESLEYAENKYDDALRNRSGLEKILSSLTGGLFKSQTVLAAENELKELKVQVNNKLKEIKDADGFISENIYYDSEDQEAGYFTLLKPASDYDKSYEFDKETLSALKFKAFSNALSLELNKSFTTKAVNGEDYFNFSTYERGGSVYRLAKNRRAVVKIGSADGSSRKTIASTNINIKGVITGAGQLVANEDIYVEAGTALDAGEENCVALCGRNVNLTKVSADNGSVLGADDVSSSSYDSAAKTILTMLNKTIEPPIDLNNSADLERLAQLIENGELNYFDVYLQKDANGNYYSTSLRGIDASAGQEVKQNEDGGYEGINPDELKSNSDSLASYQQMVTQINCWATGSTYTVVSNFKGVIYADNNIRIDGGDTNPSFALEGTMVAMNGTINMNNLYEAVIVYNPELSKIIYANSDTSFSNDLVIKLKNGDVNGSGVHNEGTLKAFNRI